MYWVTTGLAGLSILLVIVNGALFVTNQSAQAELTQRQQYINQSLQLRGLRDGIVRALAAAAVSNKDEQIRGMLAEFGITVQQRDATGTPIDPAKPAEGAKN